MTASGTHDPVADEALIRRLVMEYALAADGGDGARFAGLFVPGGVLSTPFRNFVGREVLAELPGQLRQKFVMTMHKMLNHHIVADGDRASGTVYGLIDHIMRKDDGSTVDYQMTQIYRDDYARQDGLWLIKRRTINILWTRTFEIETNVKSVL